MTEQTTEERVDQFETPGGDLRFRTAELAGVSQRQRVIEIIISPYEQEAQVRHQGRLITEVFSRGSYDGIEKRANRVKVNRDHVVERTVGKAVAFHPSREEGLVGELKIAKTLLGDETLALAEEGVLDASAGYLPMENGEVWETRNRVRITRAFLGHVALLPDPRLRGREGPRGAEGGRRPRGPHAGADELSRPNLEIVRGWMLEDEFRRLER